MTLTDRLATLLIQTIVRAETLAHALEQAQARITELENTQTKPADEPAAK